MTNRFPVENHWLLAFAGAFVLLIACNREKGKTEHLQRTTDSVQNLPEEERRTSDSLSTLSPGETMENLPTVYFGKEFREIEDPVRYIKKALENDPDIISLDPVLGGKMEFRQIIVLTEEWVLAYYDDGHLQGKAIYEYRVLPNKSVEFEELVKDHD